MSAHDEKRPIAIPLDQLREQATAVAEALRSAAGPVTGELRARFIDVRAALFQRGIFDPVLVRFDTATALPASAQEVGEQLATVASSI